MDDDDDDDRKNETWNNSKRILRIANFEAGQAEVQAEFEGALLEGEINEFAMIAGVVQSSAPAAGAANATAAAQTQIEERRPPQVIRQVQVQRVVLKEPPFKFMIEAEKVLKRIVGTKPAETHCLPFVHGKAKGCVLREHFRDDIAAVCQRYSARNNALFDQFRMLRRRRFGVFKHALPIARLDIAR